MQSSLYSDYLGCRVSVRFSEVWRFGKNEVIAWEKY